MAANWGHVISSSPMSMQLSSRSVTVVCTSGIPTPSRECGCKIDDTTSPWQSLSLYVLILQSAFWLLTYLPLFSSSLLEDPDVSALPLMLPFDLYVAAGLQGPLPTPGIHHRAFRHPACTTCMTIQVFQIK